MCKVAVQGNVSVVANKLMLGTRVIGYTVYDCENHEQILASERDIRDMLLEGQKVLGFTLTADEKAAELDGGVNIPKIAGLSISPLYPISGMVTEIHTCIGKTDKGDYEVINSRMGRKVLDKAKIDSLLELGAVINGIGRNSKGDITCWFDGAAQPAEGKTDAKK